MPKNGKPPQTLSYSLSSSFLNVSPTLALNLSISKMTVLLLPTAILLLACDSLGLRQSAVDLFPKGPAKKNKKKNRRKFRR